MSVPAGRTASPGCISVVAAACLEIAFLREHHCRVPHLAIELAVAALAVPQHPFETRLRRLVSQMDRLALYDQSMWRARRDIHEVSRLHLKTAYGRLPQL